jgi:hypothetical protein
MDVTVHQEFGGHHREHSMKTFETLVSEVVVIPDARGRSVRNDNVRAAGSPWVPEQTSSGQSSAAARHLCLRVLIWPVLVTV